MWGGSPGSPGLTFGLYYWTVVDVFVWVTLQVMNEQDVRTMFGQVPDEVPGSPMFINSFTGVQKKRTSCLRATAGDERAGRARHVWPGARRGAGQPGVCHGAGAAVAPPRSPAPVRHVSYQGCQEDVYLTPATRRVGSGAGLQGSVAAVETCAQHVTDSDHNIWRKCCSSAVASQGH